MVQGMKILVENPRQWLFLHVKLTPTLLVNYKNISWKLYPLKQTLYYSHMVLKIVEVDSPRIRQRGVLEVNGFAWVPAVFVLNNKLECCAKKCLGDCYALYISKWGNGSSRRRGLEMFFSLFLQHRSLFWTRVHYQKCGPGIIIIFFGRLLACLPRELTSKFIKVAENMRTTVISFLEVSHGPGIVLT